MDVVLTDARIAMGTGWTVAPVRTILQILREINGSTPRVLIHGELAGYFTVGDVRGGDGFGPGRLG